MTTLALSALFVCIPLCTTAQYLKRIRRERPSLFTCAPGTWPDAVLNSDGILELRCHKMGEDCKGLNDPADCSNQAWMSACPPMHYINAVRKERGK